MTGLEREGLAIAVAGTVLRGDLLVPPGAPAVVVFAHGSGSSRSSPRNRRVASHLRAAGLGTLLFDLLTAEEERAEWDSGRYRFDIALLAERLAAATDWLASRLEELEVAPTAVGYFGASTGAAAALMAAAEHPGHACAIVSRGGRPDLAGAALPRVRAPTLLLVGGEDTVVLDLNRQAFSELHCEKELIVIPGATHLFEEPGTLDAVAEHAARWFVRHLASPAGPPRE